MQQDGEWIETEAVIESCRSVFGSATGETYGLGEYRIIFSYEVNGRGFTGKFKAGSPQEEGSIFFISYNPARPEQNTGCDRPLSWPMRLIVVMVAAGLLYFANKYLGNEQVFWN